MKRSFVLLFLGAALAAPGTASAARGVVVKVDRAQKLIAVAQARGRVALVHAAPARSVKVGRRVAFAGRALANGTLAGSSFRVVGRAHSVRVRGVVVARHGSRFSLAARGAVLTVRKARAARSTQSARDSGLPAVGSEVSVQLGLDDDELDAEDVDVIDQTAGAGKIEGRLTIGVGTVTISDDDASVTLAVPAGLDLTAFAAGDEVLATFTRQGDTLVLTTLAGDDDEEEADDESEIESDDQGGRAGHEDGDHHGDD